MAKRVVDVFEMVNVADDDRQAMILANCPSPLAFIYLVEIPAVVDVGERIRVAQLFQFLGFPLQHVFVFERVPILFVASRHN